MYERSVCDRNGGVKKAYLRRRRWYCERCGEENAWNGHRCRECKPSRRVCCGGCWHHDCGVCLDHAGDA